MYGITLCIIYLYKSTYAFIHLSKYTHFKHIIINLHTNL